MCHFCATVSGRPRSRRAFLRSSLAACAYAFSAPIVWPAFAQSTPIDDADLARLTGARRILVKGGSVLTMDKQVGDFAQGDVLIEDGKIKAVGRLADTPTDAPIIISTRVSCAAFSSTACSIPTITPPSTGRSPPLICRLTSMPAR